MYKHSLAITEAVFLNELGYLVVVQGSLCQSKSHVHVAFKKEVSLS